MTQSRSGLLDAAYCLDEQAAGRTPDRARLLAGALALDTLKLTGKADRDLLDAAAGLELLVMGRSFKLDDSGRMRAAKLAAALRDYVESEA